MSIIDWDSNDPFGLQETEEERRHQRMVQEAIRRKRRKFVSPAEAHKDNLLLQSEDFTAIWTEGATAATMVAAASPSYDGGSRASILVDNGATGTGNTVSVIQTVTVLASTVYCISFRAKKKGANFAFLNVTGLGAKAISAYFDLDTGAVGATLGANNTTQGIIDEGDGFYRGYVVFTSDASDTSGAINLHVADANNDHVVTLDGASDIYIGDTQLEADVILPTRYTKTTSVAV